MKKFDLKSMSVCGWLVALFVIFPVLLVGETLTTGGLAIGCVIALLAVFVAYMGVNATGKDGVKFDWRQFWSGLAGAGISVLVVVGGHLLGMLD